MARDTTRGCSLSTRGVARVKRRCSHVKRACSQLKRPRSLSVHPRPDVKRRRSLSVRPRSQSNRSCSRSDRPRANLKPRVDLDPSVPGDVRASGFASSGGGGERAAAATLPGSRRSVIRQPAAHLSRSTRPPQTPFNLPAGTTACGPCSSELHWACRVDSFVPWPFRPRPTKHLCPNGEQFPPHVVAIRGPLDSTFTLRAAAQRG